MNFVFISPNYPAHFHQFTKRLADRGVTVLGIGDAPVENLSSECRNTLTDYIYCPSLENYDDVYKAFAALISRYGRISYVESQNEYWLSTEAKLRTDFNIKTGPDTYELYNMTHKSKMKAVYSKAGVRTAAYILPETLDEAVSFAARHGYPVIVKPDKGVGATDTHKIKCEADLAAFWKNKADVSYIEEEFVPGHIETFDGITDSNANVLMALSQVQPVAPLEVVDSDVDVISYCENPPEDLRRCGEAVVREYGLRNRFFHLEFFRLDEDKEGLGKKGDVIGLEVNMRAPGGYIPDEMNWALDADVYTIWADSILHNRSFMNCTFHHYTTHVGRKHSLDYVHSDDDIRAELSGHIMMEVDVPAIHANEIGDHVFIVRAESRSERDSIISYMLKKN